MRPCWYLIIQIVFTVDQINTQSSCAQRQHRFLSLAFDWNHLLTITITGGWKHHHDINSKDPGVLHSLLPVFLRPCAWILQQLCQGRRTRIRSQPSFSVDGPIWGGGRDGRTNFLICDFFSLSPATLCQCVINIVLCVNVPRKWFCLQSRKMRFNCRRLSWRRKSAVESWRPNWSSRPLSIVSRPSTPRLIASSWRITGGSCVNTRLGLQGLTN